jgi:tricorn protease-like protein
MSSKELPHGGCCVVLGAYLIDIWVIDLSTHKYSYGRQMDRTIAILLGYMFGFSENFIGYAFTSSIIFQELPQGLPS